MSDLSAANTPSNQKAFTDSDIQRLKEWITDDGNFYLGGETQGLNLKALLVRLEAAELFLQTSADDESYEHRLRAWRESKGEL